MSKRIPLTMDRECGGCKECCTVLGIAPLDKPTYTPCKHECAKGCAIYGEHPDDCKQYTCLWRAGLLQEQYRPDKTKLVFDCAKGNQIRVWECVAGAAETEQGRYLIGKVKGQFKQEMIVVIMSFGMVAKQDDEVTSFYTGGGLWKSEVTDKNWQMEF